MYCVECFTLTTFILYGLLQSLIQGTYLWKVFILDVMPIWWFVSIGWCRHITPLMGSNSIGCLMIFYFHMWSMNLINCLVCSWHAFFLCYKSCYNSISFDEHFVINVFRFACSKSSNTTFSERIHPKYCIKQFMSYIASTIMILYYHDTLTM